MAGESQGMITCNVWQRPLLRITPDGIEVKCKFCNGAIHSISKEDLERYWEEARLTTSERVSTA